MRGREGTGSRAEVTNTYFRKSEYKLRHASDFKMQRVFSASNLRRIVSADQLGHGAVKFGVVFVYDRLASLCWVLSNTHPRNPRDLIRINF
jgi:hypothetical protein